MTTSVVGPYSRPRYRRLRQSETGFQPWSRRRRARPISLDPVTGSARVGQRDKRRPSPARYELE